MYNKISDICVLDCDEVYKASSQVWSFKYVDAILNLLTRVNLYMLSERLFALSFNE